MVRKELISYRPKVSTSQGCVLYLPGQDDPQSATIRDRSGYGNNGTITGATWTRLSSGLWVLSFDGTDDQINCGTSASLNPTSITLAAWIFHGDLLQESEVISKWETTNSYVMGVYSTEKPFVKFVTAGGQTVAATLLDAASPQNTWYYLVATWDSAVGGTLYRNAIAGTLGNTFTGNLNTTVAGTFVGNLYAGVTGVAFAGKIGLPRIFNRALAASEIANIYNQERSLFGV